MHLSTVYIASVIAASAVCGLPLQNVYPSTSSNVLDKHPDIYPRGQCCGRQRPDTASTRTNGAGEQSAPEGDQSVVPSFNYIDRYGQHRNSVQATSSTSSTHPPSLPPHIIHLSSKTMLPLRRLDILRLLVPNMIVLEVDNTLPPFPPHSIYLRTPTPPIIL
ncbi:hypothetical protein F5880DRAFT_37404 [Lentinula raphanica]|nr:hypothetical protein F5880DRAFT_37404 [Lentinula raphanica]